MLVLPSGRSASWEFGYASASDKKLAVLMLEPQEPELMYMGARVMGSFDELRELAVAWGGHDTGPMGRSDGEYDG